jgi:hypothetical protein
MAFRTNPLRRFPNIFGSPYFSTIVRITQGARSDDLALRPRRPRAMRISDPGTEEQNGDEPCYTSNKGRSRRPCQW